MSVAATLQASIRVERFCAVELSGDSWGVAP
uniref:Uncharacterized protein n=1 Tax=Arundo donax TaxID=35708 RepID=A0A0A9CQU7_ARUDO